MGASSSKENESWEERHLPPPEIEYQFDYSRDEQFNLFIDGLQLGANCLDLTPFVGTLIDKYLERLKEDAEKKMENMMTEKIRMAIYRETKKQFSDILEGLQSNWKLFELYSKNNDRNAGMQFSAFISHLIADEPKFKRDNMMFFHLENFFAFASIYLMALKCQISNYNRIYGYEDKSKSDHKNNFDSKVNEFARFFELHCNLFIHKKLSTIRVDEYFNGYEDRPGFNEPQIDIPPFYFVAYYKNKECYSGKRSFEDPNFAKELSDDVVKLILDFYYPKVERLVNQFNKLLEQISVDKRIQLKSRDKYFSFSLNKEPRYFWSAVLSLVTHRSDSYQLVQPDVETGKDYDQF